MTRHLTVDSPSPRLRGEGRGEGCAPRRPLITAALVAAVALSACAGATPAHRAEAPAQAGHAEVDTGLETCAGCHARATPEVASQWTASRHGLALVKCVVCHGSTGADFRARPATGGCAACHPAQAASVARDGAPRRCFDCHPPHALAAKGSSPHLAQAPRS